MQQQVVSGHWHGCQDDKAVIPTYRSIIHSLAAMRHSDAINACVSMAVKTCDDLMSYFPSLEHTDVRVGPCIHVRHPGDDTTGAQLKGKGKNLKASASGDALLIVSGHL